MTTDNNEVDVIGLGASLDDIEDLPTFATLPTGSYQVRLHNGIERKEINGKVAAEVAMTVTEVIEIPEGALEHDEAPPKVGDIASQAFTLSNRYGVGMYKQIFLAPLSKILDTKVIGEIEGGCKGLVCDISVKRVPGKGDKADQLYMRVKKLVRSS